MNETILFYTICPVAHRCYKLFPLTTWCTWTISPRISGETVIVQWNLCSSSFAARFAAEYSCCVMISVLRLFRRTMHGMQQNSKYSVSVECDIRSNIKREIIRERPLGKLPASFRKISTQLPITKHFKQSTTYSPRTYRRFLTYIVIL